MTIIYLKTGYIHKIPKGKEKQYIRYYKLYKYLGGWKNKHGTIYAWEEK